MRIRAIVASLVGNIVCWRRHSPTETSVRCPWGRLTISTDSDVRTIDVDIFGEVGTTIRIVDAPHDGYVALMKGREYHYDVAWLTLSGFLTKAPHTDSLIWDAHRTWRIGHATIGVMLAKDVELAVAKFRSEKAAPAEAVVQ